MKNLIILSLKFFLFIIKNFEIDLNNLKQYKIPDLHSFIIKYD
jgi:hypothetical protein